MMSRGANGADGCPCQSNIAAFDSDIFAKLPEGVLRPGGLALTRYLLDYCAFTPGARVLDIGCGTGITVEYLCVSRGLNAVGIDISDTLLQQGRSRSSRLQLIRAAGEELPFADGVIDGVLAECSLSVMSDTGKVLNEIYRVLAPGGKLVLTDIYVRDAGYFLQASNQASTDCIAGIMNYYELTEVLSGNGFHIIRWEDQSGLLKEFVARFIMAYGSAEELWRCISMGKGVEPVCRSAKKTAQLGYFLLVAEKC